MQARAEPKGPLTWDTSARTIDAFCTTLLSAGFATTLFLSPEAADAHAPLLEDFGSSGVEAGLFIQPPSLRGAGYKHYLGAYAPDQQQEVVAEVSRRFAAAASRRARSVRTAMFSASDATFSVLSAAGFRQASLSSPGRRTPKFHAVWDGAAREAHFASDANRLEPGALPILEVPVTTDSSQCRGGVAPDLAIENGTVDRWHAPLIAAQLARHDAEALAFRALCFTTTSAVPYHDPSTRFRQTLDGLLDHLLALDERYELVPATLAEAYAHFRAS